MRTPHLGYPDAELASLAAYLEAGIRLRIHALGNPAGEQSARVLRQVGAPADCAVIDYLLTCDPATADRPAGRPGWSAHGGRFGAVRVSAVAARGGGGRAGERGDVAGCAVLRPSDDDGGCGGVVYRTAYQAGVQLAAGGFGHYGGRLRPGRYQLQAAIAAVYDEARTAEDTDWPQILALYDLLLHSDPGNPVVALNRAIAVAMVHGPRVGLDLLTGLAKDTRIATGHRLHAVRAQLLEMAGQPAAARAAYLEAARHTSSLPHQRYLHAQATRLTGDA